MHGRIEQWQLGSGQGWNARGEVTKESRSMSSWIESLDRRVHPLEWTARTGAKVVADKERKNQMTKFRKSKRVQVYLFDGEWDALDKRRRTHPLGLNEGQFLRLLCLEGAKSLDIRMPHEGAKNK